MENKKKTEFNIFNPIDILMQKIAHEKIIKESLELIDNSTENIYKGVTNLTKETWLALSDDNLLSKNSWFNLLLFSNCKIEEHTEIFYWVDVFSKLFISWTKVKFLYL